MLALLSVRAANRVPVDPEEGEDDAQEQAADDGRGNANLDICVLDRIAREGSPSGVEIGIGVGGEGIRRCGGRDIHVHATVGPSWRDAGAWVKRLYR